MTEFYRTKPEDEQEPETLREVIAGFLNDSSGESEHEPTERRSESGQPASNPELDEFELPADFKDQVLDMFTKGTQIHIGDIIRNIFSRRLRDEEYLVFRSGIFDLCREGLLERFDRGFYGLPGTPKNRPAYNHGPNKSLDDMMKDAGITATPPQKPRDRGRHRSGKHR